MSATPTARALAELRKMGFTAGVVEKWIPQMKRRVDLFGIIDLIAVMPGVGILGVQATSGSNHAARIAKANAEPRLKTWLASGGRFEVWSFAKQGARGKRKVWVLRREEIKPLDGYNPLREFEQVINQPAKEVA